MTVKIALFLSSDGIALAHRQPAGHWAMIGETAFDMPDLNAALADLRALAVEREGEAFETLIVLPDDQILYTSLTAPTGDPELTAFRIEDGLDGLTPYSVTELEYDWCELEQDRVKIAVVARETLDEARSFAAQHGFACTGFAAMPPMERFPGVPTFELGARAADMGFSADGIAFGPDGFGLPEPDPSAVQTGETAEDGEDTSQTVSDPAPKPGASEESDPVEQPAAEGAEMAEDAPGPVPGVSPERLGHDAGKSAGEAAPASERASSAEPDAPPEDPAVAPEQARAALAEALMASDVTEAELEDFDLSDAEAAAAGLANDPEEPVQTIEDPSLSGPITANPDDPDQGTTLAETGIDDGDADDTLLPPPLSPAAQVARQRAQMIRGHGSTLRAGDDDTESQTLSATREPAAAPDASQGGATAGGRAGLVGTRDPRLGLGHPDDPKPTNRTGAAVPGALADGQKAGAGSGATPMPRLAEQLQRVRSASRSRPKAAAKDSQVMARPRVEIDPNPALGQTGVSAERRPSPFDDPPPKDSAADLGAKAGSLAGLLGRRGGTSKTADGGAGSAGLLARDNTEGGDVPYPASRDGNGAGVPDTPLEDENLSSGLLARKVSAPAGGSFKTGLILTVILLLLLALVAIWSAVFLPNSAVARLFGFGDPVEVTSPEAPSGIRAPDVFTDAPLIGQQGTAQPSLEDEAAADGIDLVDAPEPQAPATEQESALEIAALAPEESTEDAALPDIDADLEDLNLPPLPAIDQGENPSLEEAEALYIEDGIWARSPERPDLRAFDLLDRVYTASIDPEVSDFDAVALPDPAVNPDETLRRFPPPPAFGAEFDLTESGMIAPTPEGVLTPDGALVISGTPPVAAIPRPLDVTAEVPATQVEDAVLAAFRPAERPGDLVENRERQLLGGLTETELGERRPTGRPASPQEVAARASLFPSDTAEPEAEGAPAGDADVAALAIDGTALAVARSPLPRTRPANIAQIVASVVRAPAPAETAVAPESIAAAPSIPSNSDVSRAATERNAIRLRNVNLIGVTGTPSERRALVRLSSGRFIRVGVGDRLDGGRVAAIGETTLQYVRSGRTVTLEIPG